MIRTQVYHDKKTGTLTVEPGWPPLPSEGDHWVKPSSGGRTKRLERKVIEIRGWRLKYEDQGGVIRETTSDTFRKWTDDRRAVPKKLREYVILKPKDGDRIRLRKKKRPPNHHKEAYVWRRKARS